MQLPLLAMQEGWSGQQELRQDRLYLLLGFLHALCLDSNVLLWQVVRQNAVSDDHLLGRNHEQKHLPR